MKIYMSLDQINKYMSLVTNKYELLWKPLNFFEQAALLTYVNPFVFKGLCISTIQQQIFAFSHSMEI